MKKDNVIICGILGSCLLIPALIVVLAVSLSGPTVKPDVPPVGWVSVDGDALSKQSLAEKGDFAIGNNRFLLTVSAKGCVDLYSFDLLSDISDYCHFLVYLYNDHLSEKIRGGLSLSLEDVALCEYVIRGHLTLVDTYCQAAVSGMGQGKLNVGEMFGKTKVQTVFPHSTRYMNNTVKLVNTALSRNESISQASIYGRYFSGCSADALKLIAQYVKTDTKMTYSDWMWPYNTFDFTLAEECARDWREIHKTVYYEVLQSLKRLNKEVSDLLSRVGDKENYAYLHKVLETSRPLMRHWARIYTYVFCDIPCVVMTFTAHADADDASPSFWFTDRDRIKTSAFGLVRAVADGKLTSFLRSHTALDTFVAYHGFIQHELGDREYKSFRTTIENVRHEELKLDNLHVADDEF